MFARNKLTWRRKVRAEGKRIFFLSQIWSRNFKWLRNEEDHFGRLSSQKFVQIPKICFLKMSFKFLAGTRVPPELNLKTFFVLLQSQLCFYDQCTRNEYKQNQLRQKFCTYYLGTYITCTYYLGTYYITCTYYLGT